MAYDPKCEELARYFLADKTDVDYEEVKMLAQAIQDTVEDIVEASRAGLGKEREPSDDLEHAAKAVRQVER